MFRISHKIRTKAEFEQSIFASGLMLFIQFNLKIKGTISISSDS